MAELAGWLELQGTPAALRAIAGQCNLEIRTFGSQGCSDVTDLLYYICIYYVSVFGFALLLHIMWNNSCFYQHETCMKESLSFNTNVFGHGQVRYWNPCALGHIM